MNNNKTAAIILAAGKGTRMNSDLPKAMMPLCGKPMIRHIIDTLDEMKTDKIVAIIAKDGELIAKEVAPHQTAIQEKQLGTASAVLAAKNEMQDFDGDILIIFGDHPIITKTTFEKTITKRREGFNIVVLGFRPKDALRYGRLVVENNELKRIVEYKDASEKERAINLCNSGVMCFDGKTMFEILDKIGNENAAGEYYLTDAIKIAINMGHKCGVIECDPEELAGANTQEELAILEETLNKRNKK